jgi:hypothetical protein
MSANVYLLMRQMWSPIFITGPVTVRAYESLKAAKAECKRLSQKPSRYDYWVQRVKLVEVAA